MPDLSFDIRASVWGEAPPQDLVGMASNCGCVRLRHVARIIERRAWSEQQSI